MSEYKYIRFVEVNPSKPIKTSVWSCRSRSSDCEIGIVKWYGAWRAYCYYTGDSVYSAGCLDDISDFIKEKMEERKCHE